MKLQYGPQRRVVDLTEQLVRAVLHLDPFVRLSRSPNFECSGAAGVQHHTDAAQSVHTGIRRFVALGGVTKQPSPSLSPSALTERAPSQ